MGATPSFLLTRLSQVFPLNHFAAERVHIHILCHLNQMSSPSYLPQTGSSSASSPNTADDSSASPPTPIREFPDGTVLEKLSPFDKTEIFREFKLGAKKAPTWTQDDRLDKYLDLLDSLNDWKHSV